VTQPRTVSVDLADTNGNGIRGTWQVNDKEQQAAWEIYVELVTRVPAVELRPDEGLLREALTSLYTIFHSTRKILRNYGPEVARSKDNDGVSFAYLSVNLLNTVLRPVLEAV